jgi:hypothetical protein
MGHVLTLSNRFLDAFVLSPEDVDPRDIADSLGNKCRWNGHVRPFYCPTEDQRILTADLQWKPAGDLKVGDSLVAFDEYPRQCFNTIRLNRRYIAPAVVTHAQRVKRPIIRLELEDGSTLRSSMEHPWLTMTSQAKNAIWLSAEEIRTRLSKGRRCYLAKYFEPWGLEQSWAAGWLAGIVDGESHFRFKNRGMEVTIPQKEGVVLAEIYKALDTFGFKMSSSINRQSEVHQVVVQGGLRSVFRLLGSFRPVRLLETWRRALLDADFRKRANSSGPPQRVVKAYREKASWVAGLETSTHTYFCEGYGAHNSVSQHSVLMSLAGPCPKEMLMHDASETYLGDWASPLKAHPILGPLYKELEDKISRTIAQRFGLIYPWPDEVTYADHAIRRVEFETLIAPHNDFPPSHMGDPSKWNGKKFELGQIWGPGRSRKEWLNRFHELFG